MSTYSLLFFGLLVSCSGCKKQDELATPAPTLACLIATQTTKELVSTSQQSKLDPETVTISAESFQVSTTRKSIYSYDKQGRILTEYNTYPGGKADSVLYQYTSAAVTIRTINLAATPKMTQTQVVALNSQGLAEKQQKPGYLTLNTTYDNNGYLVSQHGQYGTITIENGNVVEILSLSQDAGPSYTYKYEYDLSRSGFPPIQSFYGKESHNLLVKYSIQQNGLFNIYPNVYIATYTYTFDDKGLVKRQIIRGKQGEPGFIFDVNKVIVNDFSYLCL